MEVDQILQALGWVILLEGLLPFLAPQRWRRMMTEILKHHDGQLRFYGLICIFLGLFFLTIV